jgi:hypothetical protein
MRPSVDVVVAGASHRLATSAKRAIHQCAAEVAVRGIASVRTRIRMRRILSAMAGTDSAFQKPLSEGCMRPRLYKKALARFAAAVTVAAAVPVVVVAVGGGAAAPVGLVTGAAVALLGLSVFEVPRRRVTGRVTGRARA